MGKYWFNLWIRLKVNILLIIVKLIAMSHHLILFKQNQLTLSYLTSLQSELMRLWWCVAIIFYWYIFYWMVLADPLCGFWWWYNAFVICIFNVMAYRIWDLQSSLVYSYNLQAKSYVVENLIMILLHLWKIIKSGLYLTSLFQVVSSSFVWPSADIVRMT